MISWIWRVLILIKYFTIPADFKKETILKYAEINKKNDQVKIIETYGQMTETELQNSGRVTEVLPDVSKAMFQEYVAYSVENGIDFNYTINPACLGNMEFTRDGLEKIRHFLYELYDMEVRWLTVTSPAVMEIVTSLDVKFHVKTSAICEITAPYKAKFYQQLGAERVVVDPDITRDFDRLERIGKAFGDGVEIIVNNVCYKNCPYKMFHYNHEAHCTSTNPQDIKDFYSNRCSMQKAQKPEHFIRLNFIRPEDLKFYMDCGIHYFKFQGRQNIVTGDIQRVLDAYINKEYEGNLLDLITLFSPYNSFQPYIENRELDGFVEQFYKNRSFCKDSCQECGYCVSYAKKSMDYEEVEKLNQSARNFFGSIDGYKGYFREVKQNTGDKEELEKYEAKFADFD